MAKERKTYPVIDLFAGPGGLGEGFAALKNRNGEAVFKSVASIEMDRTAHNTLTLRHFFRRFRENQVPDAYYRYVSGEISKSDLTKLYPKQWESACESSLRVTLGSEDHEVVKKAVEKRLAKSRNWILVGGPPCQAYSLVGRSRMMGMDGFEEDKRHLLYREYLKIIVDHRPPVFVMENVKGLLSSKINGEFVVQKIVNDLSSPVRAVTSKQNGLRYNLHPLSSARLSKHEVHPSEFVVKAEDFGVPQARHRMFIVGIREDIDISPSSLSPSDPPNVKEVIGSLPRIRSGVSKGGDSPERWRSLLLLANESTWLEQLRYSDSELLVSKLQNVISKIPEAPKRKSAKTYKSTSVLNGWFYDERLKSLLSHEARSHMPSDLHRYLFVSAYAAVFEHSPKLTDFPVDLLPKHRSASLEKIPVAFPDRFRVQLHGRVATTITSHISKDGHYFIHYDPVQCRSLTVREAARLQTFPDNYHFEGPRTSQYHQIGNAVPPYLARQIAEIVKEVMDALPDD
ncbi:MAG: DNA (cytosine-5-)-methyltransferase [Bacteroidetes bacterium]|nr:DNA (cytosine-5-)-methyltransferase [Bacteroidota bacterium]